MHLLPTFILFFCSQLAFCTPPSAEQTSSAPDLVSEHNFDFEEGLLYWTNSGSAFQLRDVRYKCVRASEIQPKPVALEGDYWQDLCFPIGQHGYRWVSSYDVNGGGDAAMGTLTSDVFTIEADDRYFSFLVGGSNDASGERVELQVRATSSQEQDEIERRLAGHAEKRHVLARDGDFVVVIVTSGPGQDALQQRICEIPEVLLGRHARIKIIDDSTTGHINADSFQFTAFPPPVQRTPVWGFADYHTHPMDYLAFGHLKGIDTLWGSPGGIAADYERKHDPKFVSSDIPHCVKYHYGGPLAEVFIGTVEKRLKDPLHPRWWRTFTAYFAAVGLSVFSHNHSGGPEFHAFPSFLSGAHEQMHVTQIHRAWEGGLRLMVAFATHNKGAEFLASKPQNGEIHLSEELDVLKAQIDGMRMLADLNCDWMQIAYTPDEARRIIASGKLAIVLGQEMDESGQLLNEVRPNATMADEVQFLWDLGIRQMIPIHATDNRLGSPAMFEDGYNTLNDLLRRSRLNISHTDPKAVPEHYFEVREGCPLGAVRGECALYHLDPSPIRAVVTWLPFLGTTPFVPRVDVPEYKRFRGHMNAHGLTDDGRTYITELMQHGMLVDLAHMSEQSVEDVWSLEGKQLVQQGHPECAGFGTEENLPASCYDYAYPLVVSHAHFRALSIQSPDRTTVKQFLPSEYEVSDRQLRVLQRSGGLVGPFLAEATMDETLPTGFKPPRFDNDCAMSSKSFGYSYSYALQMMNARGVGLASDFTFIPGVAPRFGKNACWIYNEALDTAKERGLNSCQYNTDNQQNGVLYDAYDMSSGIAVRTNQTPLKQYTMDQRSYDYNRDGMANYGLLPDLLQDLKNVGMTTKVFNSLFSSAEDYIQTWEKAVKLSGCDGTKPECRFKEPHGSCTDLLKFQQPNPR